MKPEARAQLRQARQAAGLSLRELGERIGLSASLLSQIERGKSEPSVSSLYTLVKELGVSLDALLESTPIEASATQAEQTGTDDSRSPVIQPSERAHLDMTSGVHWEQLTRGSDLHADALLVTYSPGSKSSSDGTLMTHSGVEYAYLLEGELTLHLGFQRLVVRAGDSVRFESSEPHMYSNETREDARGLWFVVGRGSHRHGLSSGASSKKGFPSSAVDVLTTLGPPMESPEFGVA